MPLPSTLDRFLGCILGQAVGDAIGAPYEGLSPDNLYWGFGASCDLIGNTDGEPLRYTDDTQMLIGVTETLIECGEIIEERLCRAFTENYDPERGYGPGARQVLEAMAEGKDWQTLRTSLFPGGSLGNGAAMRVAPVGLLFADDLDAVMEQARLSALPTHVHPLGIEGAQLFAVAVALVLRQPVLDRKEFYRELRRRATSEEFRWQVRAASRLRAGDSVGFLGNSLEAHRSVGTAIACFTMSPDSFEHAVIRAVGQGNDTDTLAAMAGALAGAHLGIQGIPRSFLDRLEEGSKGRRYLEQLAYALHDRFEARRATSVPGP